MAITTYTGTGEVSASDYKEVKWVGKSKDGKAVTIRMKKAINLGNLDWTFKEKDDVVASLTFEGVSLLPSALTIVVLLILSCNSWLVRTKASFSSRSALFSLAKRLFSSMS